MSGLAGVGGGVGSAQEAQGRWAFSTLPGVDLWFHGMALVDPVGPGPNPLYDPAYPGRVRRAKEGAGAYPTVLDEQVGFFRDAFRGDPAFEVFHFLPLYFSGAGRTEMFAALEILARARQGIPRPPSERTALGLTAVGSVLTTREQRDLLGEFVLALEAEWTRFYQSFQREDLEEKEGLQTALQALWDREYRSILGPLLSGIDMGAGTVVLTPAVGLEGRVFGGSPQNPGDNLLVVSQPSTGGDPRRVVFSMLREFSFPLVRRALDRSGRVMSSRDEEESLAARAAIRSGALILEVVRPDDLDSYRQFFLSQVGRTPPSGELLGRVFREVFPLGDSLTDALREEIRSLATNGGEG